MKTRIISALIALPLLFVVLFFKGPLLYAATLILSIIGLNEFFKPISIEYKPLKGIVYVLTFIWFAGLYIDIPTYYYNFMIAILVFTVLSVVVFSDHSLTDAALSILAFFYIPFAFSHLVMIAKLDAQFFIWYPFIIAFITDTFAYFTGKMIGKTPLIPSVSPNKTVEGSVGGVLACVVASGIYAYLFNPGFFAFALFLGVIGAILSQIGDLIASRIKRIFEIKDFGKIMPGHGGVLDRFDSIIVTMPLVYYFMMLYQLL